MADVVASSTARCVPVERTPTTGSQIPFKEELFDLSAGPDPFISLLPASYEDRQCFDLHSPADDIIGFVRNDLCVDRLNRIQQYLGYAKGPVPPQPLNTITSSSREIVLDENIDMHWVWEDRRRMHLKPFPRYLLDSRFWSTYLICNDECACVHGRETECPRTKPYKDALGFLSSYVTLIRFESDFIIAQDHFLLPEHIKWENWLSIVRQCLRNRVIYKNDFWQSESVVPRYQFGALRLSRLNSIYAVRYGRILRGYRGQYKPSVELFQENLAPITALTVYIALSLTAMQVGLATEWLGRSAAFQNASYGFTVFSIVGPLAMILLIWCKSVLEDMSTRISDWNSPNRKWAPMLGEMKDQLRFMKQVRRDR
jgi:hypothetical protein